MPITVPALLILPSCCACVCIDCTPEVLAPGEYDGRLDGGIAWGNDGEALGFDEY
ncbi:hypothetical protein FACS1894152_3210 [Bacilli bacterium]|nr:hypothetical protein FACS1894152_3210 [Bacilli bacterium]